MILTVGDQNNVAISLKAKTWMIMKLTIALLLFFTFQVSAKSDAQKVTIEKNNIHLADVFETIEQQTGFHFFYDKDLIQKKEPIDVSIKDATLEQALVNCLKGQELTYTIVKNTVVIRPEKRISYFAAQSTLTPMESPKLPPVEIHGRVVNSEGIPLQGASILIVGTKNGTTTNNDGRFTLSIQDGENIILEISTVGYTTRKVNVGKETEINVVLELEISDLGNVVVVGYGSQKKSDLTGAISSIKGEDLTQLSTHRVDQALQGRAAGVLVQNTDGAPGGNTTIRIRGMNSINGGNNALIVIDGLQGANLNSLNPNDIASIDILKDASATAIYGAQGANGVVLITTKLGKKGKPAIGYNLTFGSQSLAHKLDLMNAADYARTRNAFSATEDGSGVQPAPIFTDAEIKEFDTKGGTDWQNVIYRTAPMQNHELSISGGTDNVKYLVSAGYLDQEGVMINSSYKRFSLRANLNAVITPWATFGMHWNGIKEKGNSPDFGDAQIGFLGLAPNVAPRWGPTVPVFDENGNYSKHPLSYGPSDSWNPLASAVEPLRNNNTNSNLVNAFVEFKPLAGLSLKITGGANISNNGKLTYYNQKTFDGIQNTGLGIADDMSNTRYQNSNILTYDKKIGDHRLTFTAVAEQQFEKYNFNSTRGANFLVDQTGIFNLGGAALVTAGSNATERVLNSYLGRINYTYLNKYLLTASYRADGSSVFGANNKWGYFPSASVAWRASEEKFIKDLNIFSDMKFRVSWGITGNQGIAPYQTLSSISSGGNYPYNGTEGTDLGFYIANAANPFLKWESTTQSNFGIDVGLFNGRLSVTADYYIKTTDDLLMPRTLPSYTGFSSVLDNIGSIENKGIEFAISGDPLVGNVRWNTGFTISSNRNKVLDLGGIDKIGYVTSSGGYGVNTPFMYLVPGEPFGQIYGYGYEGVWSTGKSSEAAAYGQLPGDPKYTDVNDDGVIDVNDVKVIGNAFPDYIFGWSNTLSYKNFELRFLIQGSEGNKLFNVPRIRIESSYEGTSSSLLDRWTPTNQDTDVPAFIPQSQRDDANLTNKVLLGTDQRLGRWVEDASYIRLKNVTLTYTLPKNILNKIHFTDLRVFISGTNMFTSTKYSGYNPEVSAFNGNDAQIGVDFSSYPQSKIISFGMNLSF
ncbi:MAG: TonB-dependent receptor [Ginsengibacter sp.]